MRTTNTYYIRLVEGTSLGDPATTISFALFREQQFEDIELGYEDYVFDNGEGYPVYRLTGRIELSYINPEDSLDDYIDEAIEIAEDIIGKKFRWIRNLPHEDLDIDVFGSYNVARTT